MNDQSLGSGNIHRRGDVDRPGKATFCLLGALLVAVCATAVAVVSTAYQGRVLTHQLAGLEGQAEDFRDEWHRLLLEQGVWSENGRVAEIANTQLGMEAPDPFAIVSVQR